MLSILIPIYNYNVYPLVLELHEQCMTLGISFEILCQDDGSTITFIENNQINMYRQKYYKNPHTNMMNFSNPS